LFAIPTFALYWGVTKENRANTALTSDAPENWDTDFVIC
jgi:hypothetical protein